MVAMTAVAVVASAVAGWSLMRPESPVGVLRYTLMVPEELALTTNYGPSIALSPDGHMLAFTSTAEGGPANLGACHAALNRACECPVSVRKRKSPGRGWNFRF